MYDWSSYHVDALRSRGTHLGPAKPRVKLSVRFTTKRNLVVAWIPAGRVSDRPGPGCDWLSWWVETPVGARPSNELLFLRDVQIPSSMLRGNADTGLVAKQRVIDAILLRAVEALVDELKQRLRLRFEVSMPSAIVSE